MTPQDIQTLARLLDHDVSLSPLTWLGLIIATASMSALGTYLSDKSA